MHPKNLSIADYNYTLPEEHIPKYPLEERDSSKLLVYKNGLIEDSAFNLLHHHLPAESLLIFNNTRVVEARLLFQKPTGGVIEIFCLEPHDQYGNITSAMLQNRSVKWRCFVGGASKWKHGSKLVKTVKENGKEIILQASIAERLSDCFVIELSWQPAELSFAEILHITGHIPLPPYLHRDAEETDKSRYQTIYAKQEGSVAAPTAGLHFTDSVLEKLDKSNIRKAFVTLHVGAGTFKPVKADTMQEHEMHAEYIDVTADAIETLINHLDKMIVAVGTTSLRTIESLYWIGVKILAQPELKLEEMTVKQWDPYEPKQKEADAKTALQILLEKMKETGLTRLMTKTQILIAPEYNLRIAKGIITNFHQPQSTLLLLVAAITGKNWKQIYQHALNNNYRFLSYGDGCLLWKQM